MERHGTSGTLPAVSENMRTHANICFIFRAGSLLSVGIQGSAGVHPSEVIVFPGAILNFGKKDSLIWSKLVKTSQNWSKFLGLFRPGERFPVCRSPGHGFLSVRYDSNVKEHSVRRAWAQWHGAPRLALGEIIHFPFTMSSQRGTWTTMSLRDIDTPKGQYPVRR